MTGLSSRIGEVLAIDRAAPAIEFEGRWWSWGDLAAIAAEVAARVPEPGAEVGVVLANRPDAVGRVLGVLQAGGCVVTLDPARADQPVASTIRPGVAVRMLTSGTTGPPRRVDLTYETFERVLVGAKHYESNQAADLRLRSGVAVVNAPLAVYYSAH